VTPEQKAFTAFEIRCGQVSAESVAEAGVLMPIAHVSGRNPIGAADRVKQSSEPAFGIVQVPLFVPLAKAMALAPWRSRMSEIRCAISLSA